MFLPSNSITESNLEIPSTQVAKKTQKSRKKVTSSSSNECTESDGSETDIVRITRSSAKQEPYSREAEISSINSNHETFSSLPGLPYNQQVDNASVISSDISRSHENEESMRQVLNYLTGIRALL